MLINSRLRVTGVCAALWVGLALPVAAMAQAVTPVICTGAATPSHTSYPFGLLPSSRSNAVACDAYRAWKATYVVPSGDMGLWRVQGGMCRTGDAPDSCTTSEGVGYGMLLALHFGDHALFDGLWAYFQKYLNANGLMAWRVNARGVVVSAPPNDDHTAATDGDLDAAYALVLAHLQWGSSTVNYRQAAFDLIGHIMDFEVEPGSYVLKPGDTWGGGTVTAPSYFAPAYFRVFQAVTGDARWAKVLETSYAILARAAHSSTGLVPDWCQVDGQPAKDQAYNYGYNAVRAPWRLAMDYLRYGEPRALDLTRKVAAFVRSQKTIVDGYTLDGTPIGQWTNSAFVAPFSAAALATDGSQAFVDAAYAQNLSVAGEGYFGSTLKTLVLLLQTGNMMYPDLALTALEFQPVRQVIPAPLLPGWSLISVGTPITPSAFNKSLSPTSTPSGTVPLNITTLWAWDTPSSKWYFYAPRLEAQGGTVLADYIASKGYLDFAAKGKLLGPGVGFWVNRGTP